MQYLDNNYCWDDSHLRLDCRTNSDSQTCIRTTWSFYSCSPDADRRNLETKSYPQVGVGRPLVGTDHGIYKDKLVVILDKPNSRQTANYAMFKAGYPYLFDSGRVFALPFCTLEEYYPKPWTKTETEVPAMKTTPRAKTKLARKVAKEILKSDFGSQMIAIYGALLVENREVCRGRNLRCPRL